MTDTDENNLNEITKFILTQNPNALGTVNKLLSIMDNTTTVNTMLTDILYREDDTDMDKFSNIINTLKSLSTEYIKKYGIILDNDTVYESNLSWFYNIVYTLQQFDSLNSVEYMLISDYLSELEEDYTDNDIIDITYKIFKLVNPNLKEELFINNVSKVYIDFLNTFKKHVENILDNMDGDFINDTEEVSEEVMNIVSLFFSLQSDHLPNIVTDIIDNPIVVDLLVLNNDNKYVSGVVRKLKSGYDKYDILDYYIMRLLNGVNINSITSDLLDIIDDNDTLHREVINLLNKDEIHIKLNNIHKSYMEIK